MANKTGVYPVFKNVFKIDTTGGTGATAENLVTIADMESFSVSIDGNVEEWKPFDQEGWTRRLVTGKALTVSVSGKRNIGDAGNDYVPQRRNADRTVRYKRYRVGIGRFHSCSAPGIRHYVGRYAYIHTRRSIKGDK